MSQVFLLLGQNGYTLREERLRWMRSFREKHGCENLAVFSAKNVTFRQLRDEVSVAPFIAAKRLIVVEEVPKGERGDIASLVKSMHPDVLLLFVIEQDPLRKPKLTVIQKAVLELSQCTEFPLLTGWKLQQWMQDFLAGCDATMSPGASRLLLDIIGEDQALLAQELRKIALFTNGRKIEEDDVRTMVACTAEREVWKLMDYLGAGRADDALRYAHGLLDRGFSPQALWSMLLWMIALLVNVVASVEAGEKNSQNIARELRANTGGIRAILPFVRKVDRRFLVRVLTRALEADRALKTGVYRESNEAPQELLALIDRSILSFAL